jgi:hypothetical protein
MITFLGIMERIFALADAQGTAESEIRARSHIELGSIGFGKVFLKPPILGSRSRIWRRSSFWRFVR